MLELGGFDTGRCRLFLKMESMNPGGSIKDRMGLAMVEAAEASGALAPGGTIIEATAGNTGIALAMVTIARGYKLVLVVPDKMSGEKIAQMTAMGADVRMTRSDVAKGHPEHFQSVAMRLEGEIAGSLWINQFANPANAQAHFDTTGPEIWKQMEHDVDAVVVGVGSGGTLTGLTRFFCQAQPRLEMVLADPQGSVLAGFVNTGAIGEPGPSAVEGIGGGTIPELADFSRTRWAYTIPDSESLAVTRALLKTAGVLAGSSSGTLVAAALRYCQEQTSAKRVVTFICDGGGKYLSKVFNDAWMRERGFSL